MAAVPAAPPLPVHPGAGAASAARPGARPWAVAPPAPASFFAALDDLHPVAAQVLFNRGLTTPTEVRAFLAGAALHDPRDLYGMDRATARLRRALRDDETVAVHGDFDVDGVTACAIVTEGLRAAARATGSGLTVVPYLPSRSGTGYGVHVSAVERLAADGATVIVTGDTGVRAFEAVERAATLGVDVIVTDHHLPGERLPPAAALVNPQQAACPYPYKMLSGAGVAWKLVDALALEGALPEAEAERLLDLVALGTIADVSPLTGENRALVQRGLRRLTEAPRPGVQALLGQGGAAAGPRLVDERTAAFSISPKLNAAGRMDDAGLALELLLTDDPHRALELVLRLEQQNEARKALTEQVLLAARRQAEREADQPVLVLRGEGWPGGVIGLVAARIAEEFGRPAFVVEVGADACRGSGRCGDGFDLVSVLTECEDLLVEFGGHARAAGFALLPDRLDALVERLAAAAVERRVTEPQPIVADYALPETDLSWDLLRAITPLRPFGAGNPEPLFLGTDLPLIEARTVGAGAKHLRTRLRFGRQTLTGFGPGLGALAADLAAARRVHALFAVGASSWEGREYLELRLQAVRPA